MVMWKRLGKVIPFALVLAAVGTVAAQEPPAVGSDLTTEVASLRQSVERLVVLMDRVLERQKVEMLIKRIELKERRLAPMMTDLRAARGDLQDNEEILERLREMLEDVENRIDDALRSGAEEPESDLRQQERELTRELKFFEGQRAELERRVHELEVDLEERRKDLEVLDATLDELLAEWLP